ncbi:MAG TPA: hypothetical protein VD862_00470 [Candidatus Paceibacterota bacterium]|nr:hypothetical protein [Candidatus Paceibacterota bacterium]
MKRFFSALKNSFALSESGPPRVRLAASDDMPDLPKPPVPPKPVRMPEAPLRSIEGEKGGEGAAVESGPESSAEVAGQIEQAIGESADRGIAEAHKAADAPELADDLNAQTEAKGLGDATAADVAGLKAGAAESLAGAKAGQASVGEKPLTGLTEKEVVESALGSPPPPPPAVKPEKREPDVSEIDVLETEGGELHQVLERDAQGRPSKTLFMGKKEQPAPATPKIPEVPKPPRPAGARDAGGERIMVPAPRATEMVERGAAERLQKLHAKWKASGATEPTPELRAAQKDLADASRRRQEAAAKEAAKLVEEQELKGTIAPRRVTAESGKPKAEEPPVRKTVGTPPPPPPPPPPSVAGEPYEKPGVSTFKKVGSPPPPVSGPDKPPTGPDKAPPITEKSVPVGGPDRRSGDEQYSGDPRSWFERNLPTFGGRWLGAKWYEIKVEAAKGPVIRGQKNLEAQRGETRKIQDNYEKYRGRGLGLRASWYKMRLNRSLSKERDYERQMRDYNGRMRTHEENLKRVLRSYEREYDEKLRPFEHEVKAERERLTALREVNGNLSESLKVAHEELLRLEDEGRNRRDIRRTPEWSRAVADVRKGMRDIERRITRNELEIAERNARLVRADQRADVWRQKKNDLAERAKSEEFEFDLPNPEEAAGEKPGAMPEYETTGQGPVFREGAEPEDKEPGPRRPVAERFIDKWNRLHKSIAGEQIDGKLFLQRLTERLKARGTDDIKQATVAELGLVLKSIADEKGVVRLQSWWDQRIDEAFNAVKPKKKTS